MIKTLKQVKSIKHILPIMLVLLTRHPRYLPDIEWSSQSWTHNVFRVYEMIFGRRFGIKSEMSSAYDSKTGKVWYACHSLESVFALTEQYIREFIFSFKWKPIKIYVPLMMTVSGIPVFASPYLFAIAFDAATNAGNTTSSPNTFAHTCTGSNRILFSGNQTQLTTNGVTGVTYNGSAFTFIVYEALTASADLWYIVAPSTGANNIAVTFTSANCDSLSTSYTGASQTGQPDSNNSGTTATTTLTLSTTAVASNCWLVSRCSNNSTAPSAGTGTTRRASNGGFGGAIGDSNGTVGTGSQSLVWTTGGSTTGGVIASFKPVASATHNGNFLAFM